MAKHEEYLGDGLYAEDDGTELILWAQRSDGKHYVALEANEIQNLLKFLERSRGVKITVERRAEPAEPEQSGQRGTTFSPAADMLTEPAVVATSGLLCEWCGVMPALPGVDPPQCESCWAIAKSR